MKITLAKKQTFWGLSHPLNYDKIIIWLTLESPSVDIDFDECENWMKAMIKNSVLTERIIAFPNPLEEEKKEKVIKKKTKKKVKKKVKSKKAKNE